MRWDVKRTVRHGALRCTVCRAREPRFARLAWFAERVSEWRVFESCERSHTSPDWISRQRMLCGQWRRTGKVEEGDRRFERLEVCLLETEREGFGGSVEQFKRDGFDARDRLGAC